MVQFEIVNKVLGGRMAKEVWAAIFAKRASVLAEDHLVSNGKLRLLSANKKPVKLFQGTVEIWNKTLKPKRLRCSGFRERRNSWHDTG